MFFPTRTPARLDQLFAPFFQASSLWDADGSGAATRLPSINVWETEAAYHAEIELPGVSNEDLEIAVDGNEVTVKAEVSHELPEGATCHRQERFQGTFHRVLRLPVDIDAENIDAHLCDGVLALELPKLEVSAPRKIKVRAS